MFIIDIDNHSEKPPRHLADKMNLKEQAVTRLYAVTEEGNSLVLHVYNFKPYFFIQVPNSMALEEHQMGELRNYFN